MDPIYPTIEHYTTIHQHLARANDPRLAFRLDWQAHAWTTEEPESWPTVYLEDISGIPFVDVIPGAEEYQHRARVRAYDGDLFACVSIPAEGYEAYCQNHLQMGAPELLIAEPVAGLAQVARACQHGQTFDTLVARARQGGGMLIHPYMGIEDVWTLAQKIAAKAEVPVKVIAPTPHALWIANDKASLDDVVRTIGLPELMVETTVATTPEALAKDLKQMAARHQRVGLKRTRCASAMGNAVFESAEVLAQDDTQTLEMVQDFLTRTEWEDGEEVLVVQWLTTDISPSTQLWIPPLNQGLPYVEGVYEQLLEGLEKVFLGSMPSGLPQVVNEILIDRSLAIAIAFQAMGYVGRCSFDFIVSGDLHNAPVVKLTECNGRWGGTSTPMYLVDRLVQGPRPQYVAQDLMHENLISRPFDDILTAVGEHLFDPTTQQGRYIFYNVGPLAKKGKLDVIVLGKDAEDVEAGRQQLFTLLGLV